MGRVRSGAQYRGAFEQRRTLFKFRRAKKIFFEGTETTNSFAYASLVCVASRRCMSSTMHVLVCVGDFWSNVLGKDVRVSVTRETVRLLTLLCVYVCVCVCRTELMRRIKRYQIALRGCAMVKYHADQRYSQTGVASHDKFDIDHLRDALIKRVLFVCRQTFPAISAHALMPLVDDLSESKYSVIGIDEGQFVRESERPHEEWLF